MPEHEWSARLASAIASQVRRYRRQREMTAQDLADACERLGLPMKRSVLSNLENSRRPTLTVPELVVLAKALGVPPILLVFPVGQEELVEIWPGKRVGTWQAAKWFTGEGPLPTEMPDGTWAVNAEDGGDFDAFDEGGLPIRLYREHDDYVKRWNDAKHQAHFARRDAQRATTDAEREARLQTAEIADTRAQDIEREMRRHRQEMRRHGVNPPEMNELLRHVDEEPGR